MSEQWTTVEIIVANEAVDSVASFVSDIQAGGYLFQDVDSDTVKITSYFQDSEWLLSQERIRKFLENLKKFFPNIAEPTILTSPLKYENWATVWKDRFKRLRVGSRLIVAPPWDKPKRQSGMLPVIIEPAEAFGTGTHETTQGCLVLLEQAAEKIVSESREFSLLDIGCGSGILAFAACKLGAKPVIAIDNDPIAIESAKNNAILNELGKLVEIKISQLSDISDSADIVTANLDFLTLIAQKERLGTVFREYLIVSGVTSKDWERLKNEFQNSGMRCLKEIVGLDWGAGLFVHG
jgi:ribosomal protein L11 methyltransferase